MIWELGWGLTAVSRELQRWRARAETIPDAALRADALHALDCKRGHTDGAALFWTIADSRNIGLIKLLVAYEVIYDYLDNVSERGANVGLHNGEQLFLALRDALRPHEPCAAWYRFNPHHDDDGYLQCLVDACRQGCRELPAFDIVRPFLALETSRVAVLAMNHEVDGEQRDQTLRRWAAATFSETFGFAWYELTAAASQSVIVFVLLAVATNPTTTTTDAQATYDAYFPWFAYGVTMLDSYVDAAEDEAQNAHSYIAHYPHRDVAVLRLCECVGRAGERLLALPNGERHVVLLGCMVAMYLSKNSAWASDCRPATARIRRSGGTLVGVLLPMLRAWRIWNRQTEST